MKIITKGINIEITEPIKDYLYKRMLSLDKFIDEDSKVEVELEKTTNHHKAGDIFRVEAHVWDKSKMNKAERVSDNMYTSIDLMQEELFNILSKKKDKKMTLFRRGAHKIKNMFRRV